MSAPDIRPDGTVVIQLKKPIKEAGVEIPALTMRDPAVKDHLLAAASSKSEEEREFRLLGNLCGVTLDAVKGLRLSDLARLRRAFQAFQDEGADEEVEVGGDAEAVTIALKRPVEDKGVELSALSMRAPTVGDQMDAAKASKSAVDRELRMFAAMCGVGVDAIKALRLSDYDKLQRAFRGFLEADREGLEDGAA